MKILNILSIATANVNQATVIHGEVSWITPYKLYLLSGILLDDENEARKLKAKAHDYCLHEGNLYKKGKGGPDIKCLTEEECQKILKELHEGVCGLHSRGRSLANRAMTQGYFWPYMT